MHQEVPELSNVIFPDGTYAFRETSDGVEEVSGGSGTGYIVQGRNTDHSKLEVEDGETVKPAGEEPSKQEMRDWYTDNQDTTTNDDLWTMYPKQSDVPDLSDYEPRHPGYDY